MWFGAHEQIVGKRIERSWSEAFMVFGYEKEEEEEEERKKKEKRISVVFR